MNYRDDDADEKIIVLLYDVCYATEFARSLNSHQPQGCSDAMRQRFRMHSHVSLKLISVVRDPGVAACNVKKTALGNVHTFRTMDRGNFNEVKGFCIRAIFHI